MAQKPLEQMTDDELLQFHAQEVGLDELNDEQLQRLDELHSMEAPQEQEGGLGRAFVQSLPMAGSMIGGGLGATFGGVGAIPGTMYGAALGKAAQTAIEGLGYGEPKTRAEIYGGPLIEAMTAGAGEGAAPYIGKTIEKTSPYIVKPAAWVLGKGKDVLKSTASSLSKVPARSMEVLYERPQEVAKIAADNEVALAEVADQYRRDLVKKIEAFKKRMNQNISKSLEEKGNEVVDITKAVDILENRLTKTDPKIWPDRYKRLTEKINQLRSVVDPQEAEWFNLQTVNANQAQNLKQMLQESADYGWKTNPLMGKDVVDVTFDQAAHEINRNLTKVAPEIKEANKQLSKIRRLDKTMNKNLIQEGKPFEAIVGVGTGENQRNLLQMKKLGEAIGEDVIRVPENIAAASYFNKAGILPREKTGSSLAPLVLSGGAGALGALQSGDLEGAIPGLMAGALASPLAIKTAIKGASAIRSKMPEMSSYMLEKMVQGAIQQGISPVIMDNFVKKSDLSTTEKALMRKQITEPQQ